MHVFSPFLHALLTVYLYIICFVHTRTYNINALVGTLNFACTHTCLYSLLYWFVTCKNCVHSCILKWFHSAMFASPFSYYMSPVYDTITGSPQKVSISAGSTNTYRLYTTTHIGTYSHYSTDCFTPACWNPLGSFGSLRVTSPRGCKFYAASTNVQQNGVVATRSRRDIITEVFGMWQH